MPKKEWITNICTKDRETGMVIHSRKTMYVGDGCTLKIMVRISKLFTINAVSHVKLHGEMSLCRFVDEICNLRLLEKKRL
jgi:hypothetical protein